MVGSGLEDAVRALPRAGVAGDAPDGGFWAATRVGRNDVWRVAPRSGSGGSYFAKFYRSPVDFRRELGGLHLARRLATGRDWLMAADILIADEREGLILTGALPGAPLREVLRVALRRDQFPWARRHAAGQVRRGLSLLVDWIGLLQREPPVGTEDLQDDRPPAVAQRVAAKLGRLPTGGPTHLATPACQGPFVLTHGDLSFGNVFFSNGRIGIVDFENMGIGPQFRDILWVSYGLEQCNFRWYYRDSGPLLDLLDVPRPDDPLAGLYRLEFVVDHLLILQARLSARPWAEGLLGLAERQWAHRELARLGRLLAGG